MACLCCAAALASAQQDIPSISGLGLPAGSSGGNANTPPILSQFDTSAGIQDDVLVGRNSPGPYPLSWKNGRAGSEVVVRNGIVLNPVTDYTFDPAAGTISFATALGSGELVRVTYQCDTPNAVRNVTPTVVPLQWDLWQSGQTRLRIASLFRSDAGSGGASNSSSPGYTALQFQGNTHFLPGSTLTSGLFLDLQNGDMLQHGGISLGEQTKLKLGEFGFSYARAGSRFAQSADGLTAGREILQATGKLTPMQALTLSLTARQTTVLLPPSLIGSASSPIGGDTQGDTTRELGGTLSLALAHGGKIEAGRTLTTLASQTGNDQLSTHDTVSVTTNLAKGTQTTVGFDASTTTPEAASSGQQAQPSYTQTTNAGFKSSLNPHLAVTGAFQNRLDSTGATDDQQFSVEATPFTQAALRAVKVTAGMEDRYQKDGATRTRQALVQLPAFSPYQLQLSGGVRQNSAAGKQLMVGLIDANARPHRYLQISGAVRLRDGCLPGGLVDPTAVNTYDLKFTLAPLKQLKLVGGWSQNPENADGTFNRVLRRNIGLQTDLGLLSLHGQFGMEEDETSAQTSDTMDLGLDLHLTRWDTLSTGFQAHNLLDSLLSGDRTYSLGFTHSLGSTFDLSLSGMLTTHDVNGQLDPNQSELKAQAKLGIHF